MQIYLVGGAVRDLLLGVTPKDRDYLVVGSTPELMLQSGFVKVGADFPVFLHPETREEYALARKERKSGAGYLGFEVQFDPSVTLADDLGRRDLTINSMAQDVSTGEIFDYYGGQHDISEKILRHTSDAFLEDPLRVVRLARFSARYPDFWIAKETLQLARRVVVSGEMDSLPNERYWAELAKLVASAGDVGLFFNCLTTVGALQHVAFFRSMFFAASQHSLAIAASKIQTLPQSLRVPALIVVANSSILDYEKCGCSSSLVALHAQFLHLRCMKRCQTDVFSLLQKCRAWSEGNTTSDFFTVLKFAEDCGQTLPLTSAEFTRCLSGTRKVVSSDFPNVQGKELGLSISNSRKSVIASILGETSQMNPCHDAFTSETKLVESYAGSHLYGTNSAESDLDFKIVVLPPLDSLLANKKLVNRKLLPTGKKSGEKMEAKETEYEIIPMQTFLTDFYAGQTYALEIAFSVMHEKTVFTADGFGAIVSTLLERFLTSDVKKMVGYAISQSANYGLKTSRFNEVKTACELLEAMIASREVCTEEKIQDNLPAIEKMLTCAGVQKVMIANAAGGTELAPAFSILQKKYTFTITWQRLFDSLLGSLDSYGTRVKQSTHAAVDWKALSHAIRITEQILELSSTGHLTFPRPNADYLRDVKLGKIELEDATEYLHSKFSEIDDAVQRSSLPVRTPELDMQFANFVSCTLQMLYSESIKSMTARTGQL